ncbi:uncharacterized protein LOC142234190 [Haematobia irritans]|uniref:uncharacterized protein LOC142234190 n=1 Tax=Haematobia irritans TaxID=7368 RepID=UPI003F507763
MSDSPPPERCSNSKSNLIEVQHVGVTAKLSSPLKDLIRMMDSSSTETDSNQPLYGDIHHKNSTKYDKLSNDVVIESNDSTKTENSRILYEMRAEPNKTSNGRELSVTPSKIEFQLYTRNSKRLRSSKSASSSNKKRSKRKLFERKAKSKSVKDGSPNLFQRLRHSFGEMANGTKSQFQQTPTVDQIFSEINETDFLGSYLPKTTLAGETRIGIYPFDHGCAEYLKTHDCPPHIHSLALAERTTHYATKFWAEFFGSLHIGVTFMVTFLLQSYRFILYSLINTLLVGVLNMTSDYLLKPLLMVIFNGFLQPPLIFCFNILTTTRDILEPIADTINIFFKPLATVGRSVRLVHVTHNKKNITKNV